MKSPSNKPPLRLTTVQRDPGMQSTLVLYFNREPSDPELLWLQDRIGRELLIQATPLKGRLNDDRDG